MLILMSIYIAHHRKKNNSSNALDVPSTVQNDSLIACLAPCGLRGCKNGSAPFPGRMSYKATNPGLVCLSYLSMMYYCIVVY